MTDEQEKIIRILGIEGLKFVVKTYRTLKAEGSELDDLLKEAEQLNKKTIDDV